MQETASNLKNKMTKFFLGFFWMMGLIFLAEGASNVQNDKGEKSRQFIQDLGDRAIKSLTGRELSIQERRNRFEQMFVEDFDYERIGKFVLGRFRQGVLKEDMERYLKLFKSTIVSTYAARFGEYNHEKFKATSGKISDGRGTSVIVSSQIIRPNDSKVMIEWHLYEDKEKFLKIYDVVVEGVSMALTQRSEFTGILQSKNGIKGLIEELGNRQQNSNSNKNNTSKSKG
jgi:phospholipid transport system substrate-binding protein